MTDVDLSFLKDLKKETEEEHRITTEAKEDQRLQFLCAGIIDKYGLEAREIVEKAKSKILSDREARAITIFEELLTEKYGINACEVIEKAKSKMMFLREPMNIMTFAEVVTGKYGPGVLEVMKKSIKDFWIVRGKLMLDELGIKERDAIGAIKILSFVHRNMGDIVEATPERAVREERFCDYSNIWGPEWCDLVSGSGLTGMVYAVNPKLVVSHEKMLTRGDNCCRIVVELKD
ncbi:hypothetical protein ACFLWG_00215 [Chloroflexota bacterium]